MNFFTTGLSGLRTSQYAMEVISNNIANADTEGFHRRKVHLEATLPDRFGAFQIGTGVSINYIERIRNQVTETSLTYAISDVSRVDQSLSIERQIEGLFQAGEGSLNQRMDVFFGELTKLTSTPGEPTQRGAVIEQASQLTQKFHQISGQLTELRSAIRFQIEQEVDTLNGKMDSLAQLSSQIENLKVTGNPNRELDQLDQLINEIATVIDVSRNEHFAAGTTLSFGGSSSIQQGIEKSEFRTFTTDEGHLAVGIGESTNASQLEGGRLRSLLDAYNVVIPEFTSKLDELAGGLIQQFDQVHATGVGTSGSFGLLDGTRAVQDPSAALSESGASFPITAGEIFVSVVSPDGVRSTESISIDPETQSLEDIALAFSAIDNLQASVNPQTNRFQIIAAPGHEFDFTGNLETSPNLDSYSGSSVPNFSGQYLGDVNQTLTYEISGTGDVGVSDNLLVNVFNEAGAQIARVNIGSGYEAGTELEVFEGVNISFPPGIVNDGDTFDSTLVSNADETGFLSSLGINSFFIGDDAFSIDVNENVLEDAGRFAAGVTPDSADTTNLFSMIELQQEKGMSGNTKSFGEYLNEVTTTIGIRVTTSTQLSSSLNALQLRYEQERDAVSGVDLNEELVYMQQFQKQYEASVRVIQTAEAMFDELFSVLR
jgi:flagellar hook-associated protein FlgK